MDEEIESKYKVRNHREVRKMLRRLGAVNLGSDQQTDVICDTSDGLLTKNGQMLRLRSGKTSALTYKGPRRQSEWGMNVREELEVNLQNTDTLKKILARVGFVVRHKYSKRREIWRFQDTVISLDTLKVGKFVEIEGTREMVTRVSKEIGFTLDQNITESYAELMARFSEQSV